MEQITALGLDVAVVAAIAVCIFSAAKKGFLRTVIQMAAYIGILMVSSTVARVAAPVLYTRVIEPALFERYEQSADGQDGGAAQESKDNAALVSLRGADSARLLIPSGGDGARMLTLSGGTPSSRLAAHLGGQLRPVFARRAPAAAQTNEPAAPDEPQTDQPDEPQDIAEELEDVSDREAVRGVIDEVLRQLEDSGTKFGAVLREQLAALDLDRINLDALDLEELGRGELEWENSGDINALIPPELRAQIMREIADQTVRPAVIGALKVVCFAVTFGVLSLVVNLLLMALGIVRYLPFIGRINAFFGGIVGLLQGLLLVWVAALLFYGVLQLCGGSWWIFSSDVVEKSFLLRYFVIPGVLGG